MTCVYPAYRLFPRITVHTNPTTWYYSCFTESGLGLLKVRQLPRWQNWERWRLRCHPTINAVQPLSFLNTASCWDWTAEHWNTGKSVLRQHDTQLCHSYTEHWGAGGGNPPNWNRLFSLFTFILTWTTSELLKINPFILPTYQSHIAWGRNTRASKVLSTSLWQTVSRNYPFNLELDLLWEGGFPGTSPTWFSCGVQTKLLEKWVESQIPLPKPHGVLTGLRVTSITPGCNHHV